MPPRKQHPKQSFFERLTGTTPARRHEEEEEIYSSAPVRRGQKETEPEPEESYENAYDETSAEEEAYDDGEEDNGNDEGELSVDMYESDNEVVIQSMIAGVTPENLSISITRDTVRIKGKRNSPRGIPDDAYHSRELYWGAFARTIELPCEIDTDGAEAVEKYGLLIIRLPKLDTQRTAELKVKSI